MQIVEWAERGTRGKWVPCTLNAGGVPVGNAPPQAGIRGAMISPVPRGRLPVHPGLR
jgi:hypothetical protein